MDEKGVCRLQDARGRCELHAEFGEEMLQPVCRTFPRSIVRCGGLVEMTGDLSCPQFARLCLLDTDSAVPTPLSRFEGQDLYGLAGDSNRDSPWFPVFFALRQHFFQILALRQYPLAVRFAGMCYLANQLDGVAATAVSRDADLLAARVGHTVTPELLSSLASSLKAAIQYALPMQTVQTVMLERSQSAVATFRALIDQCWDSWGLKGRDVRESLVSRQSGATSALWPEIAEKYVARQDRINGALPGRAARYFENFIHNHLFSEWMIRHSSLGAYFQGLSLRLAVCAYLYFSQDGWRSLLEDPVAGRGDASSPGGSLADRLIVNAVYQYSRHIEHHHPLLRETLNSMEQQGLTGLPYQLIFSQFALRGN